MKKMFKFILIGLFLLVAPSAFSTELSKEMPSESQKEFPKEPPKELSKELSKELPKELAQDYLYMAQGFLAQGDYQNCAEYAKFSLELIPENQVALELEHKVNQIANPPAGVAPKAPDGCLPQESEAQPQDIIKAVDPEAEVAPVISSPESAPVLEPSSNPVPPMEPNQIPQADFSPMDLDLLLMANPIPSEQESFSVLQVPQANTSGMAGSEAAYHNKFCQKWTEFIKKFKKVK